MKFVFIGGAHRSGTTFLGTFLNSLDSTVLIPETGYMYLILKKHGWNRSNYDTIIRQITDHWRFRRAWEVEPEQARQIEYQPRLENFLRRLIALRSSGSDQLPNLCINHTPSNFQYLEIIKKHFSDRKFIHLLRDGRAVANSVMRVNWGPNNTFTAARWWMKSIGYAFATEAATDEAIQRIRYENLVQQPAQVLRTLSDFLDVEVVPDKLNHPDDTGVYPPAHQHRHIGKPAKSQRATAWKDELSPKKIQVFEATTRDLLSTLDYQKQTKHASRLGSLQKTMYLFHDIVWRGLNRIISFYRSRIFKN